METKTWATVASVGVPPSISREGAGLNHDIVTSLACILRAAHDQHTELSRNDVELFADVFADPMQVLAAASTHVIIDIDAHLDAWQVSWQRTSVHSPFGNACLSLSGRRLFLRFQTIRLDLFCFFQA